jgi:hypothetical protein
VCGWLLSHSGAYDHNVLRMHLLLGTATVLLCTLIAVFHWRQWNRTYAVFLCLSVIVLGVTSHMGGSLTHGSGYLTRYAPKTFKAVLRRPGGNPHPEVLAPQHGVFTEVVLPILETRCGACHDTDTLAGALHEAWLGGDQPSQGAGRATLNPMLNRILLPLSHEEHMPPAGRPQPKLEEIAILRWWVEVGAPFDVALDDLQPPADVRRAIELSARTRDVVLLRK